VFADSIRTKLCQSHADPQTGVGKQAIDPYEIFKIMFSC